MPNTSMNISLPSELKSYIEKRSAKGYSTPSEYVRELIRADREREEQSRLRALLTEGLQAPVIEATPEFWDDLWAGARKRTAKRRAPLNRKRSA